MSRQKVKNVMSTDVATVGEGTPFKDVVRALAQRDVSAVPVVDRDGRVLGVVSEADLLIKQGTQEIEFTRSLASWWRGRRNMRRSVAVTAGQLDLKSQLPLVEDMTKHIDGVVDVTVSMTYRHDDTQGHLPDAMAIDITQQRLSWHPPLEQ